MFMLFIQGKGLINTLLCTHRHFYGITTQKMDRKFPAVLSHIGKGRVESSRLCNHPWISISG